MNLVGELKLYLDESYAQLKFSESKQGLHIDTIMVPAAYRSQGVGTLLINHVLMLADAMNKEVRVSARPFANFTEEKLQRLISYYGRFGFRMEDRSHSIAYMVREAKT